MDPFTFGLVFVGASGGLVTLLAVLETADVPINEHMIKIFMTVTSYGAILWLLKELARIFI